MGDLIIKRSKIRQFDKGVFANRNFKKGEIVTKCNIKILTKKQFVNLPKMEKQFVHKRNGVFYLYLLPDRYVNHSSNPNTIQNFKDNCDIALWDIRKGDEITTDSKKEDF